MAAIELRDVSLSYVRERPVLRDLSLEVRDHELLVLLGPSGCGKSTLLRSICGLVEPDSGEIRVGGEVVNGIPPADRGVALVFQDAALYPHLSVASNLAFPLRGTRAEIEARVLSMARSLRIEHLLGRRPSTLSGGEQQRVALGRAIVREPAACLMDEPLSSLDAELRLELRAEIARMHAQRGTTTIFVTHDREEAMALGQRIAVMDAGRIHQVGAPLDVYDHPASLIVARQLGTPPMNLIAGTLELEGASPIIRCGALEFAVDATMAARLRRPAARERDVFLGIRPEHVQISRDPRPLKGRVRSVEQLGDRTTVFVDVEGQAWALRSFERNAVDRGDFVFLDARLAHAHLFARPDGQSLLDRPL